MSRAKGRSLLAAAMALSMLSVGSAAFAEGEVSTWAGLQSALEAGSSATVGADITADADSPISVSTNNLVLNLYDAEHNYTITGAADSAISVSGTGFALNKGTFSGFSGSTNGSVLKIADTGSVTISGTTFSNNSKSDTSSYNGGGVISVAHSGTVAEENLQLGTLSIGSLGANRTTFSNNSAKLGSAIYNDGEITEVDADFINNGNYDGEHTISTHGAAIFNMDGSPAHIGTVKGTFTENKVSADGGAIYNGAQIDTIGGKDGDDYLAVFGGAEKGNTAGRGGAIYVGSNGGKVGTIEAEFTENSAVTSGGAVYNSAKSYDVVVDEVNVTKKGIETFTGKFTSNTAGSNGGALYNNHVASIGNLSGTYTSNSATENGGAIYNAQGEVQDVGIVYGAIDSISGATFALNSAANGGAIYNAGTISSLSGTFGGDSLGNTAGARGGAIYNEYEITTITGSTFDHNTATTDGGAIYNAGTIDNITDTSFTNNSAGGKGGAIYSVSDLTVNAAAANVEFSGNTHVVDEASVGNDIYMAGGETALTLALNAAAGQTITLGSGIAGTNYTINVNSAESATGEVIFAGDVITSSITLTKGSLSINGGETTSAVTLTNGTLTLGADASLTGDVTRKSEESVFTVITGGTFNGRVIDDFAQEVVNPVAIDVYNNSSYDVSFTDSKDLTGVVINTTDATNATTSIDVAANKVVSLTLGSAGITQKSVTTTGDGHLTLSGGKVTAEFLNQMGGTTLDVNTLIDGPFTNDTDKNARFLDNARVTGVITNKGNLTILTPNYSIEDGIADATSPNGNLVIGDGSTKNSNVTLLTTGADLNTITQKTITINSGSSLTAGADKITTTGNTIANLGTLKLSGGAVEADRVDNDNAITRVGTATSGGATEFSGFVTNKAAITQDSVKINSGANLINTATKTITASIDNDGTLTANATDIAGTVDNSGSYIVKGGAIGYEVSGTGSVTIDGTVETNAAISNSGGVTVNENKAFTVASGGSVSGHVSNFGTVNLQTGGSIALMTNRAGATIQQTGGSVTGNVSNGSSYTISGGSIGGTLTNNIAGYSPFGTLYLNGGTINAIANSNGTTYQTAGTVTTTVSNDANGTYRITGGTIGSTITNAGALQIYGSSTPLTFNIAGSGIQDNHSSLAGTTTIGYIDSVVSSNNRYANVVLADLSPVWQKSVTVNQGSTLSIRAQDIDDASVVGTGNKDGLTNYGTFIIRGDGTSPDTSRQNRITVNGDGKVVVDGNNIVSNTKLTDNGTIEILGASESTTGTASRLTITADNIGGAVTNKGTLLLNAGTLSKAITGTGTTQINAAGVYTNADNIQTAVINNIASGLYLTGGTLGSGYSITKNSGTVSSTIIQAAKTVINQGSITQDTIDVAGTLTNYGTLSGTTQVESGGVFTTGKSGTLVGSTGAINNLSGGTTTISDGTVASVANASAAAGTGVSQTGGSVGDSSLTDKTTVTVSNSGIYSVSGGTVYNTIDNYNATSALTVSGGSVDRINNRNQGKATITGGNVGTVVTSAAQGSGRGIYQSGGSVTTVDNQGYYELSDNGAVTTLTNNHSSASLAMTGGSVTTLNNTLGSTTQSGGYTKSLTNAATYTISGGTLGKDSSNVAGTINQSSGTLNVNGGTVSFANGSISGGALNVKNDATMTVAGGTVGANANVTLGDASKTGTLSISGGNVTLGSGDDWSAKGSVTVSGGTLNLAGVTQNGSLTQTSGTTNVTANQELNKNTSITGGNLVLSNSDTSGATKVTLTFNGGNTTSEGIISSGTSLIDIGANTVLDIRGGRVELDGGSFTSIADSAVKWVGDVQLNGGSLTLANITDSSRVDTTAWNKTGKLTANTGTLTINSSNVLLGSGDVIEDAVNLITYADIVVDPGSTLNISSDSEWANGKITLAGGTLNLNGVTTVNTTSPAVNKALIANTGNLDLGYGSSPAKVTLGNSLDTIAKAVVTDVNSDLEINNAAAGVTLNDIGTTGTDEDSWSKEIKLTNGTLTLDNVTKTTGTTVKYNQTGGTLNLVGGSALTLGTSDSELSSNAAVVLGEGTNDTIGTLIIQNGLNGTSTNQAQITTAGAGHNVLTVGNGSTVTGLKLTGSSNIVKDTVVTVAANSVLDINSTSGTGNSVVLDTTTGSADTWSGKVALTGTNATLTILGDNNKAGTLDADYGNLNIGSSTLGAGTLNINKSGDDIASAVAVNIASNGTLAQTAGNVVLNETGTAGTTDTWSGAIALSGANSDLTLIGFNKTTGTTNKYQQEGGSLTLDATSLTLGTGDSYIKYDTTDTTKQSAVDLTNNSTLVIGNGASNNAADLVSTSANTLTINNNSKLDLLGNSRIDSATALTVASGSELDISSTSTATGSNGVVIDASDNWSGKVDLTGGTLTILGSNTKTTGTLDADSGNLNIGSSTLGAGTLNINKSGDDIASAVAVNIASNGTLAQSAGNVVLNGNDTWAGAITLGGGTLTLTGRTDETSTSTATIQTGTYNQTAGTLKLEDSSLKLTNSSSTITGSSKVVLGSNNGTATAADDKTGTLIINNGSNNVAEVTTSGTKTNVLTVGVDTANSNLQLTGSSELAAEEAVTIGAGSTLDVHNTTTNGVTLNGGTGADKDTWNGTVSVTGGTLNLAGVEQGTAAALTQTSGTTNVTANQELNKNTSITGGKLVLSNSDTSGATKVKLTFNGGNTTSEGIISSGTSLIDIGANTVLDIRGGRVELDGGSFTSIADSAVKWVGDVQLNGGSLTLANITDSSRVDTTAWNKTGKLTANAGTLTINSSNVLLGNNDVIEDAVTLVLNTGLTDLYIGKSGSESANVYIGGTDDTWNGTVHLVNSGTLTLDGTTTATGKSLDAQTGTLNLVNTSTYGSTTGVTLGNANDTIAYAVATTLGNVDPLDPTVLVPANLHIDAGTVQLDNNDTLTAGVISLGKVVSGTPTGTGELDLAGVTTGYTASTKDVRLDAQSGTLVIDSINAAGQTTELKYNDGTNGDTIAKAVVVTIDGVDTVNGYGASTLKINSANANVTLNDIGVTAPAVDEDTWAGNLVLNAGNLTLDNVTKTTSYTSATNSSTYNQDGGTLTMLDSSLSIADAASKIASGTGKTATVQLTGSTASSAGSQLTFDNNDTSTTPVTVANNVAVITTDTNVNNALTVGGTNGAKLTLSTGSDIKATTAVTVTGNGELTSTGESIKGAVTNNGVYNLSNDTTTGKDGTIAGAVTGTGTLNLSGTTKSTTTPVAGTVTQDNVNVNSGTFTMGADVTANEKLEVKSGANIVNAAKDIVAKVLNNAGAIKGSSGSTPTYGNLTVNGDTSATSPVISQNTGTIEQDNITLVGGTFNSTGTMTSHGTFNNSATVTDSAKTGTLVVNGTGTGTAANVNSGSITQSIVTVANNLTNTTAGSSLTVLNQLTNNGTVTNNGDLILGDAANIGADWTTGATASTIGTITQDATADSGSLTIYANVNNDTTAGESITQRNLTVMGVDSTTGNQAGLTTGLSNLTVTSGNVKSDGYITLTDAGATNQLDLNIDRVVPAATTTPTGVLDLKQGADLRIASTVANQTVHQRTNTLTFSDTTANIADSNLDIHGGNINLRNKASELFNMQDLTFEDADSTMEMDVNLLAESMDQLNPTAFTNVSGQTLHISTNLPDDLEELERTIILNPYITLSPIAKSFTKEPDRTNLAASIEMDSNLPKEIVTPIYIYAPKYDPSTGNLNIHIRGGINDYISYNPAVVTTPITQQLMYLNQLNNYNEAFHSMDALMALPSSVRTAMHDRNKYAAAEGGFITYDPNQLPEESAGVWFNPYASYDKVGLKRGPRVKDFSYGGLVGLDLGMKEYKNGWNGIYNAYVGYNGNHARYDGTTLNYNGGVLGLTGVWYKNNFFTGLTANIGGGVMDAHGMYGTEDFATISSGIASKTGYNWELFNGKFIIQPNMMVAYSFMKAFDHTNPAGVRIKADPLNAITLQPGLRFIGNTKSGWQPYAGISMVWNLMDRTYVTAHGKNLPGMSVKPYLQYGVGIKKSWGERFSGWAQIVLRNGGTNGIAAQLGIKAMLGKDGKAAPKKEVTPAQTLPKAETKVQPTLTQDEVKPVNNTKVETKKEVKVETKKETVKTNTLVPDANELQPDASQNTQAWPQRKIDLSSFSK